MRERIIRPAAFPGRPVGRGDPASEPPGRRVLFLDDDPDRGLAFLAGNPGAVWVTTAAACLDRLGEQPWDEVHLDHDLGGETFVGHEREDCGMAVVRWLCEAPRPHLQATLFVVHSHNSGAACTMVFHLTMMGYPVRECPFGSPSPLPAPIGRRSRSPRWSWLARLLVGK